MAEALKHFFSAGLVKRLGESLLKAYPAFALEPFVRDASAGLKTRELLERARWISEAMRRHLPERYEEALEVIVRSLGPAYTSDEYDRPAMEPFFYLPHVTFVGAYGVEHFEASMRAQHQLTQRFTCEWSLRPYLERHQDRTLAVLREWTGDASAHVRRLCSEGTRIRLPWAGRLPKLEQEPEKILALLERLKDDPSPMVRRSVANNLNDLGRVYPELVLETAARWLKSDARRDLVEHALRGLVKRADPGAMRLLGFGGAAKVKLSGVTFSPARVEIGGKTRLDFTLTNVAKTKAALLVDAVVHFVKANGKAQAKVFKLQRVELQPRASAQFSKVISLQVHTTRKPYPGKHAVDAQVNGVRFAAGSFVVTAPR